ncbi:hypothetical protein D3C81_1267730 [compost metagenome]
MVLSHITLLVLVPTKEREIYNPCKLKFTIVDQAKLTSNFETQVPQNISDHFLRIRREQQQVSLFSLCTLLNGFNLFWCKELHDRPFELAVFDLDPGRTFGTIARSERSKIVNFFTTPGSAAFCVKNFNLAAFFDDGSKYFNAACSYNITYLNKLHIKAQVWLVRAVFAHGICIAKTLERCFNIDIDRLFEHTNHQLLHHAQQLILSQEGSLDVYLSKFRLTVCTEILITETTSDLVITLQSRYH